MITEEEIWEMVEYNRTHKEEIEAIKEKRKQKAIKFISGETTDEVRDFLIN